MINGPIILTHFATLSQVAPEPDLNANPDVTHGQVFVCCQTGRMWIVGSVTNASQRQFRQVLPHVRNADNTVGTRMVNTNGTLVVNSAVGAGEINMFNVLRVNPDGIKSGVNGIWLGDESGYLAPTSFVNISLEDSDELLSTTPSQPTSLYIGGELYQNTWINRLDAGNGYKGVHLFLASLNFTHPNQYTVKVAIEAVNTVTGDFYPLQVASSTSRGGDMIVPLTCNGSFQGTAAGQYDAFRVRAYASVADVYHSPYDAAGSWISQPPFSGTGQSPNAQYRSRLLRLRHG